MLFHKKFSPHLSSQELESQFLDCAEDLTICLFRVISSEKIFGNFSQCVKPVSFQAPCSFAAFSNISQVATSCWSMSGCTLEKPKLFIHLNYLARYYQYLLNPPYSILRCTSSASSFLLGLFFSIDLTGIV